MLLSLFEIGQFIILTLALGYIFSGFIKTDPYKPRKLFDWEDIKFAAIVSTPAVVLHEFGHKFVALAFGLAISTCTVTVPTSSFTVTDEVLKETVGFKSLSVIVTM